MRVLVTRPEPGATRTAGELRRRGFDPVIMPMSRTVPLETDNTVPDRGKAAAIAVTSAAALRHWRVPGKADWLYRLPVYAVGDATAEVARDAGFSDIRTGEAGGEQLAARIVADIGSGALAVSNIKPLIYIAGRLRSAGFETCLAQCQVPLQVMEVYDTEQISYSPDFIIGRFSKRRPTAVLFYSTNASRLFAAALAGHVAEESVKNGLFLCLSDQIAEAVPDPLKRRARSAASPHEPALLALLEDLRDNA